MKRTIRISVRNLVEFLLRSGDLTSGGGALAEREAMQAGSRVHRKLQGRRGGSYRAEVPLKTVLDCGDFDLQVEGRADGIEEDSRGTVIEEIKGIYQDVSEMEEPVPVHLAQANCYACIYGRQQNLETIRVRMVYCNLDTEETRSFTFENQVAELGVWFDALCADYRRWAALQVAWETARDESIRTLEFPFPYRAGQREMVVSVYRTLRQNKQLFVQAPTGVGKTLSAVFPAVRALGEGSGEKLFYLTAKTIARTVAEEAFLILQKQGLRCRSLTLTAKEKICPAEQPVCDPETCPRAKGHFDRINDALYAMLTDSEDFTRESILVWSARHTVCPYEMQKDLADFADAVICDYNYVFDPAARLARYFGEGSRRGTALLLVDEAHNLAERGREMFSASLNREDFLELRRQIKPLHSLAAVDRALSRCSRVLLQYRKDCLEAENGIEAYGSRCAERKEIDDLIAPLMTLAGVLERLLGKEGVPLFENLPEERQQLLECYFSVNTFLNTYSVLDRHYLIYGEASGKNRFTLKLFCVDPSQALQDTLSRCAGAIFFSATMLPMQYYESMLTTARDNFRMRIPSPFDGNNRLLLIGTDVSTRYRQRGEAIYRKFARYIQSVTAQKPGNYMVYFPSYQMLEDVLDAYLTLTKTIGSIGTAGESDAIREQREANMRLHAGQNSREQFPEEGEGGTERTISQGMYMLHTGGATIAAQTPSMQERDREAFLGLFQNREKNPADETLIGMCVMGGIFSEGIDLAGEQLIGALVIGTGLPQVSGERELLKQYYDRRGLNGFDYAYRLPGLNKVLQAAGRVIRTPEDKGVIVLLDERFWSRDYFANFPREWADLRGTDLSRAGQEIRTFWKQQA